MINVLQNSINFIIKFFWPDDFDNILFFVETNLI